MIILGLTGSIGMGKTTAARDFQGLGVPVHDADATVHALMGPGGAAVPAVGAAFPGVVVGDRVDRVALGKRVFGDGPALKRLESILHPLVRLGEQRFLRQAGRQGRRLVVLDIPLLLETGGDQRVDGVVVVTAPAFVQAARVLARPGMTQERLDQILAKQVPDRDKRRRADFIVQTGLGRAFSRRKIQAIVETVADWPSGRWPPLGMGG